MTARIALIEDDAMLRESVVRLLEAEPGFTVVCTFATAEEALESLPEASVDVVIVDLGLPGMSGLEFIRAVMASRPVYDIIVHTINEDKDTVFSALKAGAAGYVLKGASGMDIIAALKNLLAGGAPMSPRIARSVLVEFRAMESEDPGEFLLTAREKEILELLERGFSYKECSGELNISTNTVHAHIKNIYEKLQARNRQHALLKARKIGILK
ncbi:MAG: response regulator transcription factor [Deltaproteobacteria bacterium]|nr:response regulator transcription factor [Deltaproteobacteria bacterium]